MQLSDGSDVLVQRRNFLDSLADEYLHNYGPGRSILAVDGLGGSGSGEFADLLAARMSRANHSVWRASVESFHRPRELRYRLGRDSAQGYYLDSFDYDVLHRALVEPFRLGGSAGFVLSAFDVRRDIPVEMAWSTAPRDATLIIDGTFLLRPGLRGLWSSSIWVDVDPSVARARQQAAYGIPTRAPRYSGGELLYLAETDPRAHATVIVDNSDSQHPFRVFADSC